jgi:hypothetical protein
MKKSLFTLAILIGIFSTSFANNGGHEGDSAKAKSPEKTLTVDEQALLDQLNAELEISFDDMLQALEEAPVTKVVVYDMAGNILQEQSENISLDKLPKGANLLMTEGQTQYYLVD